jgi:hypothetical protein
MVDVCTEVAVTTDCGTLSTSHYPLFPGVDLDHGSPVAPRCFRTAETHSAVRRSSLSTHRTVCGVQIHGLRTFCAVCIKIEYIPWRKSLMISWPCTILVFMVLFDEALQCVSRRCGASLQVSQPSNDFLSLKLPSPPDTPYNDQDLPLEVSDMSMTTAVSGLTLEAVPGCPKGAGPILLVHAAV